MAAALVLELRALRAEVAALRESHDDMVRALLSRPDRRVGAALVPLLGELFPGECFTAAEAAARALNDRTPTGQALRELVGEFCTDSGGLRAFGRLLARLEGASLDGHRLRAAGDSRDGRRWRVSHP